MKPSTYCRNVCKAWCCRFLKFDWEPNFKDGGNDDLFFSLRNIVLDKTNNELIIPCRCRWLTNHNTCRIYPHRPKSCKEFDCKKLKELT